MASFDSYCRMTSTAKVFGGPSTYQTLLVTGGMLVGALGTWAVPKASRWLAPRIDKLLGHEDAEPLCLEDDKRPKGL